MGVVEHTQKQYTDERQTCELNCKKKKAAKCRKLHQIQYTTAKKLKKVSQLKKKKTWHS